MKYSPIFIVLLVLITLFACRPSVPSGIIPQGQMEDILYDYHVAQGMGKVKSGEEAEYDRVAVYHAVLRKHGITEAEFDSSLVFYYKRIDYLKDIYSHVNDRLSAEATALGTTVGDINRYSQYSENGDTANIWHLTTDAMLIPRPTMNRFDFDVEIDSTFFKGDSFMFQFMSEYIYQNNSKDAYVGIISKYEGDSVLQVVNHVSTSGITQVRIPANEKLKLKELKGFIYLYEGEKNNSRKMMFISQIQLIRFHNKELLNDSNDEQQDSLQADSLQRIDNTDRAALDTLRRRTPGGHRDVVLSPQERATPDRVDVREHKLKGREQ